MTSIQQTVRKQSIIAYTLCGTFLFIVLFSHQIDMHLQLNYLLSALFIIILFIALVVFYVKAISIILKNRQQLSFRLFLPTIIYSCTWILLAFSPYLPADHLFESKPVITAYYKGTQNQAILKLRANRTFELNWTGVFGYNEWFTGSYHTKGDTLFFKYNDAKPARFGTIILNKGDTLVTLNKPADKTQYFAPFKVYKPKR